MRQDPSDHMRVDDAVVSIGAWLRRVRHERGMSQEQVALAAGVAVTTYARIERSVTASQPTNTTIGTFVRLAVALEVTPMELAELVATSPLTSSPERRTDQP